MPIVSYPLGCLTGFLFMIKAIALRRIEAIRTSHMVRLLGVAFFFLIAMAFAVSPDQANAQSYRFTNVRIEGNQRIEPATILSYAGIARGETVSAGKLNQAFQDIQGSGLFKSVAIEPRGNTLVIKVEEYPTINRISFEGNRRLKDEVLGGIIQSKPRLVFSPNVAESDASSIAQAYNEAGRIAARVTPRIIRRSDNRVDLIFEIFEGGIVEISRIGFVGNKDYSDRRLRRVLETKQAGLLRAFIQRDTFVEDRIEFDKQVLRDFYNSRGYVDFRTTGVNAELTDNRDAYLLTFNVYEGQQFRFGEITVTSDVSDVDPDEFLKALKIRSGVVYSPSLVENSIARLERLAISKGLNFVRAEPRISRDDRNLALDVEFAITRGPRIFVERIDIEGNTATLDRVIRRQFKIVEGDPFNPREIRESAERIRALGFFGNADVNAREGSAPDQVVVNVNVEEKPTGSLSFGGAYSSSGGFSAVASFKEDNFLGRGQSLSFDISGAQSNRVYSLAFIEPAFLGRDLEFSLDLGYTETNNQFANYDTATGIFKPQLTFPVSERGRLGVYYLAKYDEMIADYADPVAAAGTKITKESDRGGLWASALGYSYSYDSRRTGLDPTAGVLFRVGQEFGGIGGDKTYVRTTAKAVAERKVSSEEITLRATIQGGNLIFSKGSSRATDRFLIGSSIMRGFEPDGLGPREIDAGNTGDINDALGGLNYAVLSLEAEFPLGLPEEYGISGGAFYDIGSVWGLDNVPAGANIKHEGLAWRQVAGVSIFWTSPIGPLRFNFSKPINKEKWDKAQNFEFTISARF